MQCHIIRKFMYAQNEGHIQRWTRTDNLNVILIHVLGSTFPILRRHVLRKLFTGLAALKFEIKSAFEGERRRYMIIKLETEMDASPFATTLRPRCDVRLKVWSNKLILCPLYGWDL